MICEKCGKKVENLLVNIFDHQGSDSFQKHDYAECDENAVVIDVSPNWTGNDLAEEEQRETIRCPCCNQFPFENGEIQTYEFVRIVCFKRGVQEESTAEMSYEEVLKIHEEYNSSCDSCGESGTEQCDKCAEAYELITVAIEKQIPKKPTKGKYGHIECACCGWIVESFCGDTVQYSFCPNCGQAIDWRVSNG